MFHCAEKAEEIFFFEFLEPFYVVNAKTLHSKMSR